MTRFLVSTEAAELPITVALNKCDLLTEEEVSRCDHGAGPQPLTAQQPSLGYELTWFDDLQLRRKSQLAEWGYNSVPISVHADVGLPALAESLEGRISVLAGPSGADLFRITPLPSLFPSQAPLTVTFCKNRCRQVVHH